MTPIKIPIDSHRFETLEIKILDLPEALSIVQRLNGNFIQGIYAHCEDENESYINILGGLDGRYVCTRNTLREGSLFVYCPGCSEMSSHDEPVSNFDSDWYPPEVIVDAQTCAEVLCEFVRQGRMPQGFNWHP
ncbi:MAG: hypothetical protein KDA65_06425 [Planctomycetaceae bacterium]|nr:hypothetical protein [Planctomycetaceae bacterium]